MHARRRSGDEWRQAGAGAGIVAAMMLGIRDVLEPPRDDVPVILEHDGEEYDPPTVDVYLHPDVPEATLVVLRPWLDER